MQKTIKIAVDIRDLRKAFSGTKTYLEALSQIWKENKDQNFKFIFLDSKSSVYNGPNKWKKGLEHIRFFYWKQISLPYLVRKNKCDILFCTDYFLPNFQRGFKAIVVFHDAFFFEYPEHYNRIWLFLFKNLAVPAARKSAAIIVPSQYSKERIISFTNFNENKLHVIYEGPSCALSSENISTENPLLKQIESNKYFLHVGTLNKNKNLVRLINAFTIVLKQTDENISLVLAGKASSDSSLNDEASIKEAIKKNNVEDKVLLTGFLSARDIAYAYSNAFLFAFPSFNEGFGIPVLEAFKFRIPIIAANNSSLPEIAKDGAVYFNPFIEKEMADQMILLLKNNKLREEQINKGTIRLSEFSWDQIAVQILQLFKQIGSHL